MPLGTSQEKNEIFFEKLAFEKVFTRNLYFIRSVVLCSMLYAYILFKMNYASYIVARIIRIMSVCPLLIKPPQQQPVPQPNVR